MANLNKVLLMGRLTRDPQQKFIPSGQSVVNIGLAVNRVFNVNGEKREETTFVDCEAWGQQGDTLVKYMKKGSPIFIEGRLKFESWQTKEGDKRSKLSVVVDRFQFIGPASGNAGASGGGARGGEELDPSDFGIEGGAPSGSGGGGRPSDAAASGESDVPF